MNLARLCVAAALALAACSPSIVLVDGYSLGDPARCGACDQRVISLSCASPCESIAAVATREIERRWPGHPSIRSLSFRQLGGYPSADGQGGVVVYTASGYVTVAVVDFDDGTQHAFGIECGDAGCQAMLNPPTS